MVRWTICCQIACCGFLTWKMIRRCKGVSLIPSSLCAYGSPQFSAHGVLNGKMSNLLPNCLLWFFNLKNDKEMYRCPTNLIIVMCLAKWSWCPWLSTYVSVHGDVNQHTDDTPPCHCLRLHHFSQSPSAFSTVDLFSRHVVLQCLSSHMTAEWWLPLSNSYI